jgi:gas vesicle protein
MNTQLAFAFGMLAMVAITMLVVLVVGMVKVIRHGKEFKNVQEEIGHIHRHITDTERNLYSELNEFKRRVESSTVIDDVHRRIDDEIRNIVDEIHNTRKHVDSRFDKFENKILATTTTDVATTKKQLLKD